DAPVLEIRGASLQRGQRELWADLDLTVAPGAFLAVLGLSASGKTALLHTILGMQALSSGGIRVGGEAVRTGSARRRLGSRIGYVPQQRHFTTETAMRGRDVVALGLQGPRFGLPIPRRGDRERIDELLDGVGASRFADRPVGHLSGGEQQRLRIGQALADRPELLLCDEPLSNLDLG